MAEQLPPLDALRCFSEAARLLNFRAAARSVGLTPAALGQRVKQLEELLDTRLFHRTTRSVTLTEAGLALVPYASRALAAASDCVRAGRGETGPAPMEIIIGTRHELGMSWLVPLLPRLRRAHKGLTFHLYVGSGPDLVHSVRSLSIDCAITSTMLSDPKLDVIRLHEEKYVFVASPKLLAATPFTKREHAPRHTLIDVNPELPLFRYWEDGAKGAEGVRFQDVVCMGTIAAIRALVVRGEGVALLPAYFVAPDLQKKRLKVVLPKEQPRSDFFRLVFRADDPRRAVLEALAESLREEPLK